MLSTLWRAARLAVAVLIVAALVVQFRHSDAHNATFTAGNFLSFFTVQSNLIAAGVLAWLALWRPGARSERTELARGGATLYLIITAVVVAVLLSNVSEELQLTLPWVDFVLHQLTPVLLALDWVLDPPRTRIGPRAAMLWLVYPALWLVYTLVRGEITGWYPYPFVDVGAHGYGGVLLTAAVLAACFALAAIGVAWLGNWHAARRRARALRPSGPSSAGRPPRAS